MQRGQKTGARRCLFRAIEARADEARRTAVAHEVVLKSEFTFLGNDAGAHRLVTHRHHAMRHAERGAQIGRDLRKTGALTQAGATVQVRGQIQIAEPEPAFTTQRLQRLHATPGLALLAPAEFVVMAACERIHHTVQVRANRQAKVFEVVTCIDRNGQRPRRQHLGQSGRHACTTYPTSERKDHEISGVKAFGVYKSKSRNNPLHARDGHRCAVRARACNRKVSFHPLESIGRSLAGAFAWGMPVTESDCECNLNASAGGRETVNRYAFERAIALRMRCHAVKAGVFLKDLANAQEFDAIYATYAGAPPPAQTLVQSNFTLFDFEVDAILAADRSITSATP